MSGSIPAGIDSIDPAVTAWIGRMRDGEADAAQDLWREYFGKLVALARRELEGRPRAAADEEDIALSAFKSFCRGVRNRRFPDLSDRGDLWKLLVAITLHKVLHRVRDENRVKRGGGRRQISISDGDDDSAALVERLAGNEPTPELAAELVEEYERLLGRLATPELAELAVLKLEGYTNEEIASKWGKTERTVERKLRLIRQTWRPDSPTC